MEKSEYFVRIPIEMLLDKKLSRSALLIFAVLLDYAEPTTGTCELQISELSFRAKISPATVRRAEAQLVEQGWIEIQRTGRASFFALTEKGRNIKLHGYSACEAYMAKQRKELIG